MDMGPNDESTRPTSSSTESPRAPSRDWLAWSAALGAALVTFAIVYVLLARDAFFTGVTHPATIAMGSGTRGDGLAVDATVLAIDPVTNTVLVRLAIDPSGSYRIRRRTANRQVDVLLNAANGEQKRVYPPNRPIELSDITLDASGDAVSYPFDKHTAPLEMQAVDEVGRPIPIRVTVSSDLHDWTIRPVPGADSAEGEVSIDIIATRSTPVVSFAIALMILVAILVLVTIGVVIRSIRDPSTPDFAIVASLVALLFAIPALRSSLPNAPPPGALTDFLVFFWALVIVGILMAVLSIVYVRRYGRQ
jgi:uncharacterized protein DUF4436